MLTQGVAYMHEGLTEVERKAVEALFNSGAIQVSFTIQLGGFFPVQAAVWPDVWHAIKGAD